MVTSGNQASSPKATPYIWVHTKSKRRNARNCSWTTNALTFSWILIKIRWSSCTNLTPNLKTFTCLPFMIPRELRSSKWTKIKSLKRGMCSLKAVGPSTNLTWAVKDREFKVDNLSNLLKLKSFTSMRCLKGNQSLKSLENQKSKRTLKILFKKFKLLGTRSICGVKTSSEFLKSPTQ